MRIAARLTMQTYSDYQPMTVVDPSGRRCLSCGGTVNMQDRRRRYCSIDCRQRLRYALNIRTGLLRALNTRYATFYFTDRIIVLDVLPYGGSEVFSYIFPRSLGRSPSEDFRRMSNLLGNAWWAERRRTSRKYLATSHLYTCAARNSGAVEAVRPASVKVPRVRQEALVHLRLDRSKLRGPHPMQAVKSAFRNQAKRHHPDVGGDPSTFRRILQAYEDLLEWAENPRYQSRRGFPDKWFYDGHKNYWVQPRPVR